MAARSMLKATNAMNERPPQRHVGLAGRDGISTFLLVRASGIMLMGDDGTASSGRLKMTR